MQILKKIIFGLIILVAALAAIGLLSLPRKSEVERSLVINAPAEVVFDQVNDLKKNEAWSPWKDPAMKITYGTTTEGKGASSSWTSKKMGNGTMTIAETVPSTSIKIDLDFGSMGTAKSIWSFLPQGESVKVSETMVSDAGFNPLKRWMGLLTDKMLGGYFEKGLASLKQVSETRAGEIKAEQAAALAVATPAVATPAVAATPVAAAPLTAVATKTAPAKAHAAKSHK